MPDEVNDLRLFAQMVDAGSLSAAARRTDGSTAAMSRRLAATKLWKGLAGSAGDRVKADKAEALLDAGGAISVQVLNELTNVGRRKMRM